MASGLLVMLIGKATRMAELFLDHEKHYRGRVRFGLSTNTDDRMGKPLEERADFTLDETALRDALAQLATRREQRPPDYSAVKVGGVPLYKKARQGSPIEVPMRPVRIVSLDLLELDGPEVEIEVRCSAGTYVRSLARDLGDILGLPSHLSALRRLGSGPFRLEDAFPAKDLGSIDPENPPGLPLAEALAHLPMARVLPAYLPDLRNGRQPVPGDLELPETLPEEGAWLRLVEDGVGLVALARVEAGPEGPMLRLRRNLEA